MSNSTFRTPGMPGGVLWDLDGTLVDTGALHYEAWHELLTEMGFPLDPTSFAASFGKRNDEILRELLGPTASSADIQRIGDDKEERYRARVRAQGAPLLPGAREWLSRLKAQGWRQALATSAPRGNITAVLEPVGLLAFFDAIVSADEVGRGKPDPLVFLTAAERIGMSPSRCVVVEDAPAGLEGARRGGMAAIGVLSSHHGQLEADLVVESLTHLAPDAFSSLLRQHLASANSIG
jgi:beta-phosphoglucomutase family hydrolase